MNDTINASITLTPHMPDFFIPEDHHQHFDVTNIYDIKEYEKLEEKAEIRQAILLRKVGSKYEMVSKSRSGVLTPFAVVGLSKDSFLVGASNSNFYQGSYDLFLFDKANPEGKKLKTFYNWMD